jgi:hypothetical protein
MRATGARPILELPEVSIGGPALTCKKETGVQDHLLDRLGAKGSSLAPKKVQRRGKKPRKEEGKKKKERSKSVPRKSQPIAVCAETIAHCRS